MRVQAKRPGFYGNVLRRRGDVFTLSRAAELSARWMVQVPSDTPERRTGAQAAIEREREAASAVRSTRRPADPAEDRPVDFDFDPFV